MTVRQLINELLDMPMDSEVQIVYTDKNYDYDYQDALASIYYDDDNIVGIIGTRIGEMT